MAKERRTPLRVIAETPNVRLHLKLYRPILDTCRNLGVEDEIRTNLRKLAGRVAQITEDLAFCAAMSTIFHNDKEVLAKCREADNLLTVSQYAWRATMLSLTGRLNEIRADLTPWRRK